MEKKVESKFEEKKSPPQKKIKFLEISKNFILSLFALNSASQVFANSELTLQLIQAKLEGNYNYSLGSFTQKTLNTAWNADDQVHLKNTVQNSLKTKSGYIKLTDLFNQPLGARILKRVSSEMLKNNQALRELAEGRIALNIKPFELMTLFKTPEIEKRPSYKVVVFEENSKQIEGAKIASNSSGTEFIHSSSLAKNSYRVLSYENKMIVEDNTELAEEVETFHTPEVYGSVWRIQKTLGIAHKPFSSMELKFNKSNGDVSQGMGVKLRESNDLMYITMPFGSSQNLAYGIKVPYGAQAFEFISDKSLSVGNVYRFTAYQNGNTYYKFSYFEAEKKHLVETNFIF
jgi:hypothetical protein